MSSYTCPPSHLALLLGVLAFSQRVDAQAGRGAGVMAIRQQGLTIEALDSAGSTHELWRSLDASKLAHAALSSDARLASVVSWSQGQLGDVNYVVPPSPVLTFVRVSDRAAVRTIEGVVRYAWCGSDCVAVVYGHYYEDAPGTAVGDSMGVVIPSTGERRGIAGLTHQPQDVLWNRSHSSLLVMSSGTHGTVVLKITLSTGDVSTTAATTLAISPSGLYFLAPDEAGDTPRVRLVATGRVVEMPNFGVPVEPLEWSGMGDRLLVRTVRPRRAVPHGMDTDPTRGLRPTPSGTAPEYEYRLWEPTTGRTSKRWRGHATAWQERSGVRGQLMQVNGKVVPAARAAAMEER